MDKYNFITVEVHPNGVVRLYGDGGFLSEVRGDYVTVVTNVDALPSTPSGQLPAKKPAEPTPLKVGDRVKVVKIIKSEPGWHEEWVDEMDEFVGKEFTISVVRPQLGIQFIEDENYGWNFPPSCVEKV